MLTKLRIQKIIFIFIFMFMWILCCSCTNNQVLKDKTNISSSNINDSQNNIYFINNETIYSIDKNTLLIKKTDLKAQTLYVFNNTLYFKYGNQIYKDTTAILLCNEPFVNFIVTDGIIWLNTADIIGRVLCYDLVKEIFKESEQYEFPIVDANESAVYMMNIEERTKTKDGHFPYVHVLDMNGTKIDILTVYDGYYCFNTNFYLYKNNMFFIDADQIFHIDLKSNINRIVCDIEDEIISVAHDCLYYRSGSNLKILTLSDGQIIEYTDVFDDDHIIYVDSYINVIYKIDLIHLTVEKITVSV